MTKLNLDLCPKEKVKIAINMTDVCVRICSEGIRNQHPSFKEKDIIEKVRKRILENRNINKYEV